ncbi:MAG TPA: histidine kinase [Puia sp.]|nr:histidine kinase [Puia sp.]
MKVLILFAHPEAKSTDGGCISKSWQNLFCCMWLKPDTTLLLTACLLIGLRTSISITRIWQKDLLKSQQLVQKQLDSELSFLKAQIHPHFFFNTLNIAKYSFHGDPTDLYGYPHARLQ